MTLIQIIILAVIQGAAELLPVSSSAHVIVAEKLMGLDPSSPEMTFFLVMLHTGTMFAVLAYFAPRWRKVLSFSFVKRIALATLCTGVVGLGLKKAIEKILAVILFDGAEIESLFRILPLVAAALFGVGLLIIYAGKHEQVAKTREISQKNSILIGLVQGLCLPFRGFSRSGATISAALLSGVERTLAEDFSFALAVVLTPPVVLLELHRLKKLTGTLTPTTLTPGFIGMAFSFAAGLLALKWLSAWLESGKWRFFGYYCIGASAVVTLISILGY
ncbi:undecaprenyl-diphosphate phosphatase [Bdellovibrionota bacterium FG-1]